MPEPNPCLDIVKIYHDLGGEIITVGSDAHEVKFLLTDLMSWLICLRTQDLITTQYLMKESLSSSDYDGSQAYFIYMYLICTFYIHL